MGWQDGKTLAATPDNLEFNPWDHMVGDSHKLTFDLQLTSHTLIVKSSPDHNILKLVTKSKYVYTSNIYTSNMKAQEPRLESKAFLWIFSSQANS